jgi:hypothetical protein
MKQGSLNLRTSPRRAPCKDAASRIACSKSIQKPMDEHLAPALLALSEAEKPRLWPPERLLERFQDFSIGAGFRPRGVVG